MMNSRWSFSFRDSPPLLKCSQGCAGKVVGMAILSMRLVNVLAITVPSVVTQMW